MKDEFKRLQTLLPNDLSSEVAIAPKRRRRSLITSSKDHRPTLIRTKKLNNKCHNIEIDFNAWQEIDLDYRNLLFWHEVARIQQHSVRSDRWALVVLATGLGMSVLEVTSQQVILLSIYLLLTVIALWQLYQNNRGESYLRTVTQADQGAILLAQQFGYSLPRAYRNLHGAIKMLIEQSHRGLLAKQYQTRLQVLEISAVVKQR
jgi:Protein of unknown function (DUF3318)